MKDEKNIKELLVEQNREKYYKLAEKTFAKVHIAELLNFDNGQENIKVSVIVPVCNVEEYLRECLDSIINQTLQDIEIICINDGSKDNSMEILREYANNDNRVKVINKENAGYGHAMNIGMDMAKGKYIGIVESDDYVDIHMYEDLFEIAETNEVDYVKADFNRFVREEGNLKTFLNHVGGGIENYNKVINPIDLPQIFRFVMNTWSGIYSRDFLVDNCIRHNETPGASYQDNGFFFQTTCNAKKIMFIRHAYYYNRRDNPNSSVYSNSKLWCMRDEYKFISDILFEDDSKNAFLQSFYLKKFHNYRFTYQRVDNDLKKEFLEFWVNELKKDISNVNWCWDIFNNEELEEIHFILDDTEKYYDATIDVATRISVIIPMYNEEEHIEECLSSVLSQSLRNIEVICIDDGSTDNTISIINSFIKNDSRIVLLQQENSGSGVARNYGLSVACGEFVCFMDADDFYPSTNILRNLYLAAKHNGVNICGGSFSSLQNGKVQTVYDGIYEKYTFKKNELINYSDYQFEYGYHRFIYNLNFLKENGVEFPKYLRFQDPPFFVQAMIASGNFYSISQVVYRYRKNNNKVTWNEQKIYDLLCGIRDNMMISNKYKYSLLHYSSISKVNGDFLKLIMQFLNTDNLRIYLVLIEIQSLVSIELLQEISPKYDDSFIIKPLYRILNNSVSYKQELDQLKKSYGDAYKIQREVENCNTKLDKLDSDLKETISKNNDYLYQILSIRASLSYKIGLVITWIPRNIRKLFARR